MKKKKSGNKSLFDHITHITQHQTKGYWDSLNETEKKQWSNYMIHRFISMKMEYVEVANEFQKYKLKPKDLYKLYSNVLPKKKEWLRYVKGKKTMKYEKWVVEIVAKHYESSLSEAREYLDVFYSTEQNKANLKTILQKYGSDTKEIKKLNLP
jgi:heterodisulfide reductase subunit B